MPGCSTFAFTCVAYHKLGLDLSHALEAAPMRLILYQCRHQVCAPEPYAMLCRAPMSEGDAYLRRQTEVYHAQQAQGRVPYGSEFAVNFQPGNDLMHHHTFQAAQSIHMASLHKVSPALVNC